MAININLGPRQDVDPYNQPIPRSFVGFDPKVSDEQLWNANRGAWPLPEQAAQEQFATFSHDGTIRLVAELEGVENVEQDGRVVQALLGRLLHRGDPVRDALVGRAVEVGAAGVSLLDTAEQDAMIAAERYAPQERTRRTFLITHDTKQWFWTPDDERELINRTAAGATVRECWSCGGRRQGIEPGDRVYLLERCEGEPRGVRGAGVVSSRIYSGEHWDDPARTANYVDIDWDLVLDADEAIGPEVLRRDVPGYGWNPQKSGVELHQPMAEEMDRLWGRHTGNEKPAAAPREAGWDLDDARRRVLNSEAKEQLAASFEEDGWEVARANEDRPFFAVAFKGDEQSYLFAKGTETVGRPVLLRAEEVDFIREHQGDCVLGVLSDVEFEQGSIAEGSHGILTVVTLDCHEEDFQPVVYRFTGSSQA
ncbi:MULTISPECIES: hypothetical protein [unclassified Luteococcus]|uniref:hypothetical protein n=1 Tax=unclassified Luteococcus TaxID=2639923 RepID=UPI00313BBC99